MPAIATAAAIQGRDLMTCLKRRGEGMTRNRLESAPPGMQVRLGAAEDRNQLGIIARHLEELPAPLAHVGTPGDELFPFLRARPEDPDVCHPVPRLRIWSVSILHRAGLCRHTGTTARGCPKAMSPLEMAGGAKTADGRRVSPSARLPRQSVSRVLFPAAEAPGDGHLSGTVVANRLEQPTRGLPISRPGGRCGSHLAAYLALLRLGVTEPPLLPAVRWALTPPFHPYPRLRAGRSVFCGPVRRLSAPRRYLAVYPLELGLSSSP